MYIVQKFKNYKRAQRSKRKCPFYLSPSTTQNSLLDGKYCYAEGRNLEGHSI